MDASLHPIRAYRLRQDPSISLEDLADRVGTSKPNLHRIETGKQKLSEDLLFKIVAETAIPAHLLRPDLAILFWPPQGRTRPRRVKSAAKRAA